MDIKEIQNLIKFVAKSGASEVKLETDDVKITIRTGPLGASYSEPNYVQHMPPMAQSAAPMAATPAEVVPAVASQDHLITIKSPIIGTFYRRSSPDKPNFVEVGTEIKKGDVLCVIEAMKLFNDIEAEISGKIVKILVDDSSPVEFDQPLFVVDPS